MREVAKCNVNDREAILVLPCFLVEKVLLEPKSGAILFKVDHEKFVMGLEVEKRRLHLLLSHLTDHAPVDLLDIVSAEELLLPLKLLQRVDALVLAWKERLEFRRRHCWFLIGPLGMFSD